MELTVAPEHRREQGCSFRLPRHPPWGRASSAGADPRSSAMTQASSPSHRAGLLARVWACVDVEEETEAGGVHVQDGNSSKMVVERHRTYNAMLIISICSEALCRSEPNSATQCSFSLFRSFES
jgi:hypothetical protein